MTSDILVDDRRQLPGHALLRLHPRAPGHARCPFLPPSGTTDPAPRTWCILMNISNLSQTACGTPDSRGNPTGK
ncbi:hypothetical protein DSECCO2_248980 [anaerobic digester metagenome]